MSFSFNEMAIVNLSLTIRCVLDPLSVGYIILEPPHVADIAIAVLPNPLHMFQAIREGPMVVHNSIRVVENTFTPKFIGQK